MSDHERSADRRLFEEGRHVPGLPARAGRPFGERIAEPVAGPVDRQQARRAENRLERREHLLAEAAAAMQQEDGPPRPGREHVDPAAVDDVEGTRERCSHAPKTPETALGLPRPSRWTAPATGGAADQPRVTLWIRSWTCRPIQDPIAARSPKDGIGRCATLRDGDPSAMPQKAAISCVDDTPASRK